MAIKIPSKNIYEMNNPKIIDNPLSIVDIETKNISTIFDSNTVFSKSYDGSFENGETEEHEGANSVGTGTLVVARAEGFPKYIVIPKIYIPVLLNNSYIDDLTLGKDEDGNPKIKASIIGNIYKGTAQQQQTETSSDIIRGETIFGNPLEKEGNKIFELKNEYNISITRYFGGTTVKATAEININNSLDNRGEKTSYDKQTIDGVEYFVINNLKVFCGIKFATMGFDGMVEKNVPFWLEGEYVDYQPYRVDISFYGNTIGIDLTDGSVTYGSGKKPHSLSGNELLQDSGKVGETLLTEHLANNVLNQYQKGKETATLLCDIADYYDESGEKIIDIKTNKMSFRLHDEVIPYIFGANGKDEPMSRKQDGSPKVFEIIGSNIIYDGAVWQELTLLEI